MIKTFIYTTDITKIIQQKISQSIDRKANISLIWIPGHGSIEWNENTDEKAKVAAKSSGTPKLNITTYTDFKN